MNAATSISRRVTGMSLILSPVLTSAGWYLLRPTIGRGPTPAWTVSHVLLASGWTLYVPAALGLAQQHPSSVWAQHGTVLVVLAVPVTLAQFALDLLGASRASTQADMDAFFGHLLAKPLIAIPLYQVGPSAAYIGWLLHAIGLLRSHATPWWTPVLILVALLSIGVGQTRRQYDLVLAGHVVLGSGFAPLGWSVLTRNEPSW